VDDREQLLQEVEDAVRTTASRLHGSIPRFITPAITRTIVHAIARRGLVPLVEHPIAYLGRKGRLDVAGWDGERRRLELAVEIDGWHSTRSIRKLEEASRAGASILWVRWGRFIGWELRRPPPPVRCIEVPIDMWTTEEIQAERDRRFAEWYAAAVAREEAMLNTLVQPPRLTTEGRLAATVSSPPSPGGSPTSPG
jgi:hypothetical protein